MHLFDDGDQTDNLPKRPTESLYGFYTRIGLAGFAQERDLLERWFSTLPPAMQVHVRSDIRSGDDNKWYGAFWEMYLYRLFVGLGYVVTYEPGLNHRGRSPDLLVERDGVSAWVEAQAVSGDQASERRRAAIEEAINQLVNPHWSVWVTWLREAPSTPAISTLQRELSAWLDDLDPGRMAGWPTMPAPGEPPSYVWSHQGWQLEFRPIPKPEQLSGQTGSWPTILGSSTDMELSRVRERIRRAVMKKGNHYGVPDRPLVVALLCNAPGADDEDIVEALFGRSAVQVTFSGQGEIAATRSFRQPDGAWRGPFGMQYKRVSALIVARQLFPSTVLRSVPTIWLHPDPTHRCQLAVPFRTLAVDPTSGALVEGGADVDTPMHEILGLPAEWPGGDPWDDST